MPTFFLKTLGFGLQLNDMDSDDPIPSYTTENIQRSDWGKGQINEEGYFPLFSSRLRNRGFTKRYLTRDPITKMMIFESKIFRCPAEPMASLGIAFDP